MRGAIVILLVTAALAAPGCEPPPTETNEPRATPATPTTAPEPRAPAATAPTKTTTSPPDAATSPTDDPPPRDPPRGPAPPDDPRTARFHGLSAPKPATWIWHPVQSGLRTANWYLPGRDGADQAELVVFGFAPGEGGTREQNIERWRQQFRSPAGEPVEATIREQMVGDLPVTVVELAGEYMKMGAAWYTPDQALLGAIIDTPDGLVILRITGPEATVQVHRAAFLHLIDGLRVDAAGS